MAHDVMLVSVCVMSGGLGAAESALNLLVQAKLHIDLDPALMGMELTEWAHIRANSLRQ